MTSRRQKTYKNQDFAQYYDGVTIFWLIFSLFYIIGILGSNESGILILSPLMGCVGYQIGLRRNRNPVRWFCYGILLNIFIIFLILLIKVKETDPMIVRSREFSKPEESLKKRDLLKPNENIIFQQTATYKGGMPGYPKISEDCGIAFVLNNSFVFYDREIKFKLFFNEIKEVKLDFYQMSEARGFWAFGDGGRQLQQTKNTINLYYFDNKNVERSVNFQIHGAITIPGEEVKAREFLNHLLEFKEQFTVSHKQSVQQLDDFSKLEKLKTLKDKGVISDAEFEIKKKQFLDEI